MPRVLPLVPVIVVALAIVACSDAKDSARSPAHKKATPPALRIDPRTCTPDSAQHPWTSGTDRIAVEGTHDGSCKVVVSREQNGETEIYDCMIPPDAPAIEVHAEPTIPFQIRTGRLACRMVALAHAHGGVTDVRADPTVYRLFVAKDSPTQ